MFESNAQTLRPQIYYRIISFENNGSKFDKLNKLPLESPESVQSLLSLSLALCSGWVGLPNRSNTDFKVIWIDLVAVHGHAAHVGGSQ